MNKWVSHLLHMSFSFSLCVISWWALTNLKYTMAAIMIAYLDIPISGISLFTSFASEDIPLENLMRLPTKGVESTLLGSFWPSHTNVLEGLAPAPLVLHLVWPLYDLWNSGPTAPRWLADFSCSRSIHLTKEDIVEFNLQNESSDIITNNRL